MNKGIKLSTGDVIGFLHSDDFFADENVIEKVVSKFNSPDVDAVYSDLVYVSRDNGHRMVRQWNAGEFSHRSLKFGWMPPHTTLFVRKLFYNKTGLFDTELKIASDYDWMLRFFSQSNGKIAYINEVLVKMRSGGRSNSAFKDILLKSSEDYKTLKKNNYPFPAFTLISKNLRKIKQFLAGT
jgi:glycosyltransferase